VIALHACRTTRTFHPNPRYLDVIVADQKSKEQPNDVIVSDKESKERDRPNKHEEENRVIVEDQ